MFTGYWLKCQLGFNFFDSISISWCFPFSYLHNDVLAGEKPGPVINEDFDHFRICHYWPEVVFHHNFRAISQVSVDGYGEHSNCLQITCRKNLRWSYPFSKLISVKQGDVFHLEGFVDLEKDSMAACLCIAAFDENKKIIDWQLAVQGTDITGTWVKVQKQFTITNNRIRYISFRGTGGRGAYRFDNLLLARLK